MTTAVPGPAGLAGPVSAYAGRLHAAIGDRHYVASPLGAWLLLALCGPAATGESLAELTEVLGCDTGSAAGAAAGSAGQPASAGSGGGRGVEPPWLGQRRLAGRAAGRGGDRARAGSGDGG